MSTANTKPTLLSIIIGILAIITGVVHFSLGLGEDDELFRWLFMLNGLGYIALTIGYLFPNILGGNHNAARWALLLYTAVTFVLYFVMNGSDAFGSATGLIDKLVELIIIILLFVDMRQARKHA
jgi:hypothetical protein